LTVCGQRHFLQTGFSRLVFLIRIGLAAVLAAFCAPSASLRLQGKDMLRFC
jgi:hypothetical protein